LGDMRAKMRDCVVELVGHPLTIPLSLLCRADGVIE